jgi:hypothetical protein
VIAERRASACNVNGAESKLEKTMIYVEGIIIPANWDNNGNVVDLAIATRDEEEYLITDKDQIARLKPLLRQEVEIEGITQIQEGKIIIKVKKFSKLSSRSKASKKSL